MAVINWIDRLNRWIGCGCGYCLLVMVLVQLLVVVLRYVFNIGFLWLQESVLYLHLYTVLLAAGYTLVLDAHVRVDVFYRRMSARSRAVTNLAGIGIFLLPMCLVIAATATPFAFSSWAVLEGSDQPSGLPAVFLLKSALIVFAVLLGLQGAACGLRVWHFLSRDQIGGGRRAR